jgi:hypothetical protein
MNKDPLIHEIGLRFIKDISAESKTWLQAVVVVVIENNDPAISGFFYNKNGQHEPYAPREIEAYELALQLRDVMAADDKKSPWKAALIRIDRKSRKIDVEFEYKKLDRWDINLSNTARRADEFRPAKI